MYQTVARSLLILAQSQCLTDVQRLGNAAIPPRLVNLLLLEREDTYGDRAYLPMSACDELSLLGYNIYDISLLERLQPL